MIKKYLIITAVLAAASSAFAADNQLAGSEWGPENGYGQFVQFKAGNELFGFAGCNSFIGNFSQTAKTVSITNLIITEKSCPEIQGAEDAFIAGLKAMHRIDSDGIDMKVYDVDGRWILALRKRDWD